MRNIILPGEALPKMPSRAHEVIEEDGRFIATVIGMYDDEKGTFWPLEGVWYPMRDEIVIGIVEEAKLNSYTVNLNSLYKGIIIAKYSSKLFAGDVIEAQVRDLDETKTVVLMHARKLSGGKMMSIKPSKVHRILGREDTMIREITEGTQSMINVGMNGVIWIKGGDVQKATEAIMKIEEEAHTSGLTERIKSMLSNNKV
jgi:exosome complex component RRP4